jgi:DNA helicase HerA-like ATPase
MADVKGDLAGLAASGSLTTRMADRLKQVGLAAPEWRACPVEFWDTYGALACRYAPPCPTWARSLLARLLGLNDTQRGVLTLVFKIADDAGMLLLDIKDLKAMLAFVGENASKFTTDYGKRIGRFDWRDPARLARHRRAGRGQVLREPMLNIDDLIQTGAGGRGVVNILAADRLLNSPQLYATFLLWMLSELFERLPEVGESAQAEAGLLFRRGAPAVQRRAGRARRED